VATILTSILIAVATSSVNSVSQFVLLLLTNDFFSKAELTTCFRLEILVAGACFVLGSEGKGLEVTHILNVSVTRMHLNLLFAFVDFHFKLTVHFIILLSPL
jgi:hypothetical protein